MSRLVLSLALLLPIAVGTWTMTTSTSSAGPLETSGSFRWIVFASRQNVDEAIGLARDFGSESGPTNRALDDERLVCGRGWSHQRS